MIFRTFTVQLNGIVLILTTASLYHLCLGAISIPAEHLVPPPLPTPQHLKHYKVPTYTSEAQSSLAHENTQSYIENGEPSSIMTRIARWFGLATNAGPPEQQISSATHRNTNKIHLENHNLNQAVPQTGKAPCNLCNKYPWVPMLPLQVQYPLINQYQQQFDQPQVRFDAQASQNHPQAQAPSGHPSTGQQLPLKQRAVQFNFPAVPVLRGQDFSKLNLMPLSHQRKRLNKFAMLPSHISVPNLSASALPPLFKAEPFRPLHEAQATATITSTSTENAVIEQQQQQQQQLPSTEPEHFVENIGAHSELRPDRVIPTQIPPSVVGKEPSFEIIKSHQITDFVTSVEYPATYVQSPAIDLSSQHVIPDHKLEPEVDTVEYQHQNLNPNLSPHIPASQLITKLDSFGSLQKHLTQRPLSEREHSTSLYTPQIKTDTTTSTHQPNGRAYEYFGGDNFPSASSHNHTEVQQDHALSPHQGDINFTTTAYSTEFDTLTQADPFTKSHTANTESLQETNVQFVPSLQTYNLYSLRETKPDDRDTPKRLLDAPIRHIFSGKDLPRPFTRDPGELNLRFNDNSVTINHRHPNQVANTQFTSTPTYIASPAVPTPTSLFSAVDASGHFAGIAAPTLSTPTKSVHQIIIPYTMKNRPRPFEPTRAGEKQAFSSTFERWTAHSNVVDIHEQQESKVVSTQLATEVPANSRRTTKFVTKILAANLRDLLRREHEIKTKSNSSNFDLSKLQKNIDDWTEQEYTSLSHRPSTPTIRGRSKHIPAEYLTTTPSPRRAKTTNVIGLSSELPASINNLESSLLDHGSKRFHYIQIDDNHLLDVHGSTTINTATRRPPTTATPAPITTADRKAETSTTPLMPNYKGVLVDATAQEPAELWRKAKVSISPQTQEKIYVVTPQPSLVTSQREISTSTEVPIVKSPRFIVRPTPGSGTFALKTSSLYRPELFGLMGLSAYVPANPVEIIDGNSKVVTIVTSTPTSETNLVTETGENIHEPKIERLKSTMAPSPR